MTFAKVGHYLSKQEHVFLQLSPNKEPSQTTSRSKNMPSGVTETKVQTWGRAWMKCLAMGLGEGVRGHYADTPFTLVFTVLT